MEPVDPRVLLFRCRKEGDSRVIDVAIQAGVSFHRFAERLSNAFGKQVPEFSFFSTEDRKEVHVADEAAFGKCKTEMLAPSLLYLPNPHFSMVVLINLICNKP